MIVVRVELHHAVTGEKRELARMLIDNIGGTPARGNYRVRTLRGRSARALDRGMRPPLHPQREGRVLNHARHSLHVWHLVAKALASIDYGHPVPKKEKPL